MPKRSLLLQEYNLGFWEKCAFLTLSANGVRTKSIPSATIPYCNTNLQKCAIVSLYFYRSVTFIFIYLYI